MSADQSAPFEPFIMQKLHSIAIDEGFTEGVIIELDDKQLCGSNRSVQRVLLKGTRNRRSATKTLIVKTPPLDDDDEQRVDERVAALFAAEIRMYEKYLRYIVQFQRDKGISYADGFYNIPDCAALICDANEKHYALIMEDLEERGYMMMEESGRRPDRMDEDYAMLVADELGRFHGTSFAVRDQRPDIFEPFAKLENLFLLQVEQDPRCLEFYTKASERALAALDADETDAELKRKYGDLVGNLLPVLTSCLRSKPEVPFRVIGHCDFWNRNIMFQYDKVTRKPIKACIIDYQCASYISPVLDIAQYLLLSTDTTFRRLNMDKMLQRYHKSVSDVIQRLGSDPERLFSWTNCQEEFRKFGVYCVLVAPYMIQENNRQCSKSSETATEQKTAQQICDMLRDAHSYGLF